jgi:hypothetical protein
MSPQPQPPDREITPAEFRPFESKVELLCKACGKKGKYVVGRIFIDPHRAPKPEEHGSAFAEGVCFTGYFHCRHCGAGGPWDLTPMSMVLLLALLVEAQANPRQARIQLGELHLFDGTVIRTATEGEAYLKKLLEAQPEDDFLWGRLGNLYDSAGELERARAAYEKAVEWNPRNVEAHYTLGCYCMNRGEKGRAREHFHAVLRHCRAYSCRQPQFLHDLVRDTLERLCDLHEGTEELGFLPPFDPAPAQGGDGRIPAGAFRPADLSTNKGWETLTRMYLTGTLPASRQMSLPAGLLGNRSLFPPAAPARVGRNDRCPCGSGRKFKNCCLKR